MRIRSSALMTGIFILNAAAAQAGQIVYAPTNPLFQPGNALNGPTLLAVAEAQKKKESSDSASGIGQRSIAETVKASFVARLSSQLYNQIFGDGAGSAGTFDLGDGNIISFVRGGGNVTITFTNPDGSRTVITVPDTL